MKRHRFNLILPLCLSLFFLSGCWDNVELDSRAFVTAIAIDKNTDEGYAVSMEMPKVSNEKSIVTEKEIKADSGKNLSKTIYGMDKFTDKTIYLGHMKMVVLSEDVLNDENFFRQTADSLLRDRDVSRKLIVLACKNDAAQIIKTETDDEKLTGVYISTYYKKNNPSIVYRQDLDKITKSFAEDGHAVIPQIISGEKRLELSGAAVLKDYKLKGWLDETQLNGLLWVTSQAKGAKVEAGEGGKEFVVNIDKYKAATSFFEKGGIIYTNIDIKLDATVEETAVLLEKSENIYGYIAEKAKEKIKAEINEAYDIFYNQLGVDGFNIENTLKKKEPDMHKIYFENMGMTIDKLPVAVNIEMSINGTGSLD